MKITIVSTHEKAGGAAIAAERMFMTLQSMNVETVYLVNKKVSKSTNVVGNSTVWLIYFKVINKLARLILKLFFRKSKGLKSLNIFPSNTLQRIQKTSPDITILHWVNEEFLPLRSLNKIEGKVIWPWYRVRRRCVTTSGTACGAQETAFFV